MSGASEWSVRNLGERRVLSPLGLSKIADDEIPDYVPDGMRVLHDVELSPGEIPDTSRSFEKAGPREYLFFDPKTTRAGIVTAGGLCPGINNVIRSLVLHLVYKYGVQHVTGFRYGFAGLDPASGFAPVPLGAEDVLHVHARGGTMLGTSRGSHDPGVMVETLAKSRIDCLFAIGGDGTMRAAHAISEEAIKRGMNLAVVGIPKTIDNDIPFVDKTFGFETAVSMAKIAIDAAHTEALSALHGIGLVRLMGRSAGFIAAHAALASHDVNVCLVPEVRFDVDGPHGLLAYLKRRLETRGHAVVVVAEGCGMRLAAKDGPRDASGNLRFASADLDIGTYLKERIEHYFAENAMPISLKYIDPSYMLRGVPANAIDAVFCDELARYAAHAAMAGKTDVMVGRWHRSFTHVPLPLALSAKKRIDPHKELWLAVTETTGQPRFVA
ncbi:MAG: Diphosphate--fructose-6-phosphate1-phosphotransferase [Labilithrix sp.]|nr:Diphosphate--fructose-6-phosphate1-phosphotransferase [Labilithrix sp.]